MTTYVWRVQHRAGFGPYWCEDLWSDEPGHGDGAHPNADDCFGLLGSALMISMGACCGFENRKMVGRWFSSAELRRLETLGFFLVRVPTDGILMTHPRQCLFLPRGRFERAKAFYEQPYGETAE